MPDSCHSNPCMHGASCIHTEHGYFCVCPFGFVGDTCDEGNLMTMLFIFHCLLFNLHCNLLWLVFLTSEIHMRASLFDKKVNDILYSIDVCASKPCLHNGECEPKFFGYSCKCLDGFTGSNCEIGNN